PSNASRTASWSSAMARSGRCRFGSRSARLRKIATTSADGTTASSFRRASTSRPANGVERGAQRPLYLGILGGMLTTQVQRLGSRGQSAVPAAEVGEPGRAGLEGCGEWLAWASGPASAGAEDGLLGRGERVIRAAGRREQRAQVDQCIDERGQPGR